MFDQAGPGSEWLVAEADELLREFDCSPSRQAQELAEKADVYEDGAAVAQALHDEMRRRARAGVRFWPSNAASVEDAIGHIARELAEGRSPVAKLRSGRRLMS